MTALGILRVAWARKGWIAGPVVVTSALAALLGAGLERRASYVASRVLSVTEGAQAEAVFACKSVEVLSKALSGSRLEGKVLPQELASRVKAEVEGRLVRLSVVWSSSDDAEYLVERIASEAARAVVVHAQEVSAADRAAAEEIEERLRQLRANRDAAQRELAELTTSHPVEQGPHGELRSVARRRLIETQDALAAARRELAELDAEIAALQAKPSLDARVEEPAGTAAQGRLAELDRKIAELREEMTDLHPRLATLLAERARLASAGEGHPARPRPGDAEPRVSLELASKEALRARLLARVAALEKEEKDLSERVRLEAAAVEERVARTQQVLKRTGDDILAAEEELERARRSMAAKLASRAALSVKAKLPVETRRSGASPGLLGTLGAALGLVLGALLAALAEALDPAIRTGEDVTRHLDIPVLAEVPADALLCSRGGERSRASAILWLVAFLLAAAFMLVLVYPGWEAVADFLRRLFAWAGDRLGMAVRPGDLGARP